MYKINFSNQSKKYIKNLDSKQKLRIKKVIDILKEDPFSYPYKKLVNMESDYRIRVGNYRITYSVYKKELIILVIKIGKRENFYS